MTRCPAEVGSPSPVCRMTRATPMRWWRKRKSRRKSAKDARPNFTSIDTAETWPVKRTDDVRSGLTFVPNNNMMGGGALAGGRDKERSKQFAKASQSIERKPVLRFAISFQTIILMQKRQWILSALRYAGAQSFSSCTLHVFRAPLTASQADRRAALGARPMLRFRHSSFPRGAYTAQSTRRFFPANGS